MRSWVGPIHWPPWSIGVPSAAGTVRVRPPTRSRASSTTTSAPASTSRRAAARPASPAPTTTTSVAAVTAFSSLGWRPRRRQGELRRSDESRLLARAERDAGRTLYSRCGERGTLAVTEDRETPGRTTSASVSPAPGEIIGSFPIDGPEQVAAAVARARQAAEGWAELGFEGRRKALLAFKPLLARPSADLVALVPRENGKPDADAFIEVLMGVEHLDWAARNAAGVLGPRRARSTLTLANHAASVEYQPLGVVGVIGPWNYPVLTPLGSIVYALAAGNAGGVKPGERPPAVGWFRA